MEELGRLEQLTDQLSQSYPGARLDDIDLDDLRVGAGRTGQGRRRGAGRSWNASCVSRASSSAHPTAHSGCRPRLFAGSASRRCAMSLTRSASRRGDRATRRSGAAGEPTGASRPWAFGDTESWNVPRTLLNAQLRRAGGDDRLMDVADVEVIETEHRTQSGGGAVCRHVLVDGAGRPLDPDEAHGTRAAPTDLDPVPDRCVAAHHLRPRRGEGRARRADRAGGHLRPGHEPAPRAAARRGPSASAPGRGADRAGGDRRRADRARRTRWRACVLLPAAAGDVAGHGVRARSAHRPATRRSPSSCSATTRGWPASWMRWPAAATAGWWRRIWTASAPRSSPTTCAPGSRAAWGRPPRSRPRQGSCRASSGHLAGVAHDTCAPGSNAVPGPPAGTGCGAGRSHLLFR